MTDDTLDDADVAIFFQKLKDEGVMSAEALGELSEELASGKERTAGMLQKADVSKPAVIRPQAQEANADEPQDLRTLIADMTLPEKIKLAMLGDATARQLLVTDTNRLVQQAVLNNPRIRDAEVEAFAKNTNVSDFVLRFISANRSWMKNYSVKYALVINPKTPPPIGIKWLRFLHKNDLRKVARSKNIPQLIAISARKRLAEFEKR